MNINITFEEALQRASKGLQEKMLHSVELLRKAEKIAKVYDQENGYYLAFSGGKDSQALIHMAQLAGVQFKGHMNLTSVDPPEVIRFVKKEYPEIELIKPKDSIYNIAIRLGILPTMRVRWCCAEFKESAGAGKVTLIGIRKQESVRRSKRNEVEITDKKFSGDLEGLEEYRKAKNSKRKKKVEKPSVANPDAVNNETISGCITGKDSLLISPIIYWTENDVWEFLNKVVCVPHCSLYDEGWHRLGCIGCPMSSHKQKMIENERYPHVKRNWIKAIKAIRMGGGITKQTYRPDPNIGGARPEFRIPVQWMQDEANWDATPIRRTSGEQNHQYNKFGGGQFSKPCRENRGMWKGFSDGSSPDGLTEEQENEIAENIYDWWISGKPYKKWYAEKFQQLKLNFEE